MGIPSPRTCLHIGFLLSGAAAVGYQILWQRQLSLILAACRAFTATKGDDVGFNRYACEICRC